METIKDYVKSHLDGESLELVYEQYHDGAYQALTLMSATEGPYAVLTINPKSLPGDILMSYFKISDNTKLPENAVSDVCIFKAYSEGEIALKTLGDKLVTLAEGYLPPYGSRVIIGYLIK